MSAPALESKEVQKIRKKLHKRLRKEIKALGKRTLKKIASLIHLKLDKQLLDTRMTTLWNKQHNPTHESQSISRLRKQIDQDTLRTQKLISRELKVGLLQKIRNTHK